MANINDDRDNASFMSYQKVREGLEEKFMIDYNLTAAEIQDLKIRDQKGNTPKKYKARILPEIPNEPKEAFKLFIEFYAAWHCELQKEMFETSYKVWNESTIKAELDKIDEWINNTSSIKLADAVIGTIGINRTILNANSDLHEFVRLKSEFYEGYLMGREQHNLQSIAATVYGRYFLFKNFLIERLKTFNIVQKDNSNYTTLKEVFVEVQNYDQAISALVKLNYIDQEKNNQIKNKLKGVVSVLIEVLRGRQFLNHINDSDLVPLLNREFKGLNLSEKTAGKTLRNIRKKDADYKTKLKALIK